MICNTKHFLLILILISLCIGCHNASAEDWGYYSIVPVSGQTFVLEAVDSGTTVRPLVGSPIPAVSAADQVSTYVPPVLKPEDILPGEIKQFQFNTSQIFPGTVRDVTVFIPAQYDGSKPACVYVKTDGYRPNEKTMLETMIAGKEMPVTVGVFVRPGEVPAPMDGTLGRRNRDFEYDGVSDNNVRFLIDELLPFVAEELNLNLSTDGNDRCLAGGSSGGIAALTAAWNRPDAFSRVFTASESGNV